MAPRRCVNPPVNCVLEILLLTYLLTYKGMRKLPAVGGDIQWCRNEFESGDHRSGEKVEGHAPKKIFLVRAPPFCGSKSTISRFGERFRDGQYSLVSFLFAVLLLTVPPVPSHL